MSCISVPFVERKSFSSINYNDYLLDDTVLPGRDDSLSRYSRSISFVKKKGRGSQSSQTSPTVTFLECPSSGIRSLTTLNEDSSPYGVNSLDDETDEYELASLSTTATIDTNSVCSHSFWETRTPDDCEAQQRELKEDSATSRSVSQPVVQFQNMSLQFSMTGGAISVGILPVTAIFPALKMPSMFSATQDKPSTSIKHIEPAEGDAQVDLTSTQLPLPYKSRGPSFGYLHRFHRKAATTGFSHDLRGFTKQSKGRLSLLSENKIRYTGVHHYSVQFTAGELSSADGIGFIFSSEIPCSRNIKHTVSIFAHRTGRICIRSFNEVKRCNVSVKQIEIGDWVEVVSNLDARTITFSIWSSDGGLPSTATVNYGHKLDRLRLFSPGLPRNPSGYLAVAVKNIGVSVSLAS